MAQPFLRPSKNEVDWFCLSAPLAGQGEAARSKGSKNLPSRLWSATETTGLRAMLFRAEASPNASGALNSVIKPCGCFVVYLSNDLPRDALRPGDAEGAAQRHYTFSNFYLARPRVAGAEV